MHVNEFLTTPGVMIDVRSPGEFRQGHIPGAINLPLLDDAEHAQVGTCYKQEGPQTAFNLGVELITPKLTPIVERTRELLNPEQPLLKIYSWRGYLRSLSIERFLQECGLPTIILKGGYKAFRSEVLSTLAQPRKLAVVGGLTGSGKTAILHALRKQGEAILDLEELAHHRGGAFGALPSLEQPTNEHFENRIAWELFHIPLSTTLWIENEVRLIGSCKVPDPLFNQLEEAPLFFIEKSLPERLLQIAIDYLPLNPAIFVQGTEKIRKKLGGARTDLVKEHLLHGRKKEAAILVLDYYDKTYEKRLAKRPAHLVHRIPATGLNHTECAESLTSGLKQFFRVCDRF